MKLLLVLTCRICYYYSCLDGLEARLNNFEDEFSSTISGCYDFAIGAVKDTVKRAFIALFVMV